MIFKKPVIFINSAEKINNPDYGALDIKTLESTVREYFGYDISPKNLVKLNSLIEEIDLKNFKNKNNIDNFINEKFFNFNNATKIYCEELFKLR